MGVTEHQLEILKTLNELGGHAVEVTLAREVGARQWGPAMKGCLSRGWAEFVGRTTDGLRVYRITPDGQSVLMETWEEQREERG